MVASILAVCITLNDSPLPAVRSLKAQTYPVERIIVVVGSRRLFENLKDDSGFEVIHVAPNWNKNLGSRLAEALNSALDSVDLARYGYILRLDADLILPHDFIETNLRIGADLVGEAGAMLIDRRTFSEVCRGRFEETFSEDTYVAYAFVAANRTVQQWAKPPIVSRPAMSRRQWSFFIPRGREMYRLGYEPFHVAANMFFDVRNVLATLSYTTSAFANVKRFDFARRIFVRQFKSLRSDLKAAINRQRILVWRVGEN